MDPSWDSNLGQSLAFYQASPRGATQIMFFSKYVKANNIIKKMCLACVKRKSVILLHPKSKWNTFVTI